MKWSVAAVKKRILSLSGARYTREIVLAIARDGAFGRTRGIAVFSIKRLSPDRPANASREDTARISIKLFIDPLPSGRKIERRYIRGDNKATHLAIFIATRFY